MCICKEIIHELSLIRIKVKYGGKPLEEIDNLIQKIESMNVENLKIFNELDTIVKEIEELKKKYNII